MSKSVQNQAQETEPDFSSVREVLETGEKVGEGNRKSVYHSGEVDGFEDKVVKVFSSDRPREVRDRVKNADPDFFPVSHMGIVDLDNMFQAESYSEKTTVVVQEQSQDSIVDTDLAYDRVLDDTVDFTDSLVARGDVIDDYKLEAIHVYEDGLKFVDFEDRRSQKDFPFDPESVQTPSDVDYRMACMYASLAHGLSDEYGKNLEPVMEDMAVASEEINEEVFYDKGSFSEEMIDYSSLSR
jgi:hypothetical protein